MLAGEVGRDKSCWSAGEGGTSPAPASAVGRPALSKADFRFRRRRHIRHRCFFPAPDVHRRRGRASRPGYRPPGCCWRWRLVPARTLLVPVCDPVSSFAHPWKNGTARRLSLRRVPRSVFATPRLAAATRGPKAQATRMRESDPE